VPYTVSIAFDRDGVTEAACSCPYDWGGWCKHVVAVLLTCIHEPQKVGVRPPLRESLESLSREQLQTLLLVLAADDPNMADRIESELGLAESSLPTSQDLQAEPHSSQHTLVDTGPIRRRVYAILHSLEGMRPSRAYWYVGSVVDQVRQMLAPVEVLIEAGDGRNARTRLEAITDAYINDWLCLDDSDGFASEFLYELGDIWITGK